MTSRSQPWRSKFWARYFLQAPIDTSLNSIHSTESVQLSFWLYGSCCFGIKIHPSASSKTVETISKTLGNFTSYGFKWTWRWEWFGWLKQSLLTNWVENLSAHFNPTTDRVSIPSKPFLLFYEESSLTTYNSSIFRLPTLTNQLSIFQVKSKCWKMQLWKPV